VVRGTNRGKRGYWTANLSGVPDDFEDANDNTVLSYHQACDKARAMGRGETGDSHRPASWAAALDAYEKDLVARAGSTINASRVRGHLPPALLDKPVVMLAANELRRWRDDLLASGLQRPTVRRILAVAKASLNLAANLDPRITNRSPWNTGLSGVASANASVSRVISDADVLALVAGAYALDPAFGLFIDVLASTGTRTSQATRLLVGDLQDGTAPRLMIPSSRKGGKGRKSVRRPVPIPLSLARKLERAAAGRPADAPLLLRSDGSAWNPNRMELSRSFAQVAKRTGIDQTAYCLRHSSIVRALIAGTPTRVVAANHDTSTIQLERVYSAFIADHADAVSRRGLLDTEQAVDANVIPMAGRR
jgi:integrase